MTFVFEATDTAAHLAAMALYFLSNNPTVQEKARKEVKDLNKSFEEINLDDL